MAREKIVYLLGAGATQAEITHTGDPGKVLMPDLATHVFSASKKIGGAYANFVENFALDPEEQDIEWLISLFEAGSSKETDFDIIARELRAMYRSCLVERITQANVFPIITCGLLHLHKEYAQYMGMYGEEVLGVLTVNNDSLIEKAFCYDKAMGGLNCGYPFNSTTYKALEKVPPLLKLHGSFNWKIRPKILVFGKKLSICDEYENGQDDQSGWIPPSVFKKPDANPVFNVIWKEARALLSNCDVLRVVGCRMRNEDFQLLYLVFSSQIALMQSKKKVFKIELIMSEESGQELIERIPFLTGFKRLSETSVFSEEPDPDKTDNPYYYWIKRVIDDIQAKCEEIRDDSMIMDQLLGGKFS